MGRGYQGAVLNVLRAPEFELDILDVSPAGEYTRVRVHNEDLLGHDRTRDLPPTVWVRLWVPEEDKEHQRGYTLVEMDHDAAEATIYFLHHEPPGPASRWALGVQAGARIPAQLYGGTKYRPPVAGTRLLLVGDPASVPAIADALAAAPPSCTADVVLQAPEEQWLPLGDVPGSVIRVHPDRGSEGLVEVVSGLVSTSAPDWAWVALESTPTRRVRRALLEAGVPRGAIQHQAYWVRGRAMGRTDD
ncbi:siderophore-interacting protein [Actinomyces sp.]|uniref:siderophore-interacting protein n=1 Tax=Actinomyces sp. TaxID=29317 RepID=UPI00289E11EF|nr:siderophore-interacting protein [Actinomyces sp.]